MLRLVYADGSAADILYTSEGDAALGKERKTGGWAAADKGHAA